MTISRLFRFDRDFEAAFPPELLAGAVTGYLGQFKDESSTCSLEDIKNMLAESEPFVRVVEKSTGFRLASQDWVNYWPSSC